MPKNSPIKITQTEEVPMPVVVIAGHVAEISKGIKKLQSGPMNDRALFLLIQHAIPAQRGGAVSIRTIKAVIQGINDLERTYLKKK
jgi:hypothetical protein